MSEKNKKVEEEFLKRVIIVCENSQKAASSLMDEVCHQKATNWGIVNDAGVEATRLIIECTTYVKRGEVIKIIAKMFKLGVKVRDKVTGFEGIVTSRVEYMNGCVQYCVKPKAKKGEKMPDGEYIDVEQLEYVDDGVVKPKKGEVLETGLSKENGGVMMDTPKF